jgi:hypothetical protein
VEALLWNPRLVEDDLVAWIVAGNPSAASLEPVGRDQRWIQRPGVLSALLRSSRTPRAVALGLLRRARREDWLELAGRPGIDPLVAACARRLLEETT